MQRVGVVRGIGAVAAAGACLALAAPAGAATFPVTTNADTGAGSLRQAIADAQANGVEVDDIPINVTGNIDLASSLPLISTPMTITGPGADDLTVRASGAGYYLFGVFTTNASHTVKIEEMTIADAQASGFAGGGIGIGAALGLTIVDRVRLTGNTSASGGAIHNSGRLELSNSTLDDNEAAPPSGFGGGLTSGSAATTTVRNTTITGNRAAEFGGGIHASGTGSIVVESSTITANKSDSDDSGLTGDGGGINQNGAVSFSVGNTILAGNTVGTSASMPDLQCSGTFTSLGYNLRSNADAGCLGFPGMGDAVNAAPGLGTFGDHGGPTPTVPLLDGSPALNTGNPAIPGSGPPACEATDQRGFSRVAIVQPCDKGAVEAQAPLFQFPGHKTVPATTTLTFTLAASDPDPDPLTFFMLNGPPGATLDPSTGVFSWTPSVSQIGVFGSVEFGADDGTFQSSSGITITVAQPPPPPPPPSSTPVVAGPTGQRAAALKKCKRKKGTTRSSRKARKKCRKKANRLPV